MAICGTFATWRHLSLPFDIEYDKSLSVSTSRSRLPHPVRELSIHAVKQKYSFQKPEWKGNENGKCLSQLQNPVFSNSHFKFPLLPQSEKFATNGRVTGSKDDHTDGFSMTGA